MNEKSLLEKSRRLFFILKIVFEHQGMVIASQFFFAKPFITIFGDIVINAVTNWSGDEYK